jgi:hypothetical protein
MEVLFDTTKNLIRRTKMDTKFDRRDFLKISTAAVGGLALGGIRPKSASAQASQNAKSIRLGFVGVGDRGSYHLDCALGIEGVEIPRFVISMMKNYTGRNDGLKKPVNLSQDFMAERILTLKDYAKRKNWML